MFNSPKNFYKKLLGRNGEKLAEKYLKKNGYSILETNYVCHYGEADIIASKNGVIVFVEVKTRTSDKFGLPKEAVDAKKQEKYRQICQCYFYEKRLGDVEVAFDVIEILNGEINHIKDALI